MVSSRVRPIVRWIARVEYFHHWATRFLLYLHGAIPLKRGGVPVTAIRTSIALLRQGEVVGIFPEAGVRVGRESVLRGGPIRGGAALLAIRSGAPIVPIVVLGTEKLNQISPWLPARRGRLYVSFGEPLRPDPALPRRLARIELTERLRQSFALLYAELLQAAQLRDDEVP